MSECHGVETTQTEGGLPIVKGIASPSVHGFLEDAVLSGACHCGEAGLIFVSGGLSV